MNLKRYKYLSDTDKEKRLISFVDSILRNNIYRDDIFYLLSRFNLTRSDIIQAFLDYNLDVYAHNNEIYRSQAIRIVLHLHNLIEGSWHIVRQQAVCQFIKQAAPSKAIDLGFGVPSRYIKDLLTSSSYHLTLCDNALSAFEFAEALLEIWNSKWGDNINFLCADMENVKSCIGDYDLYITLHSIEHVHNPTTCLADYVKLSLPNALFLIEIPIGPITPEHYISWDNTIQAIEWINSVGLEVINQRLTYVNPAVDLFAEPHCFNYSGYLALCKKETIYETYSNSKKQII